MVDPITSEIMKKIPYVGPVIQNVGIAIDAKKIIENSTPLGAVKIISVRFVKECTPLKIFITRKCVMFAGSVVASVTSGGNSLILISNLASFRFIIKEL